MPIWSLSHFLIPIWITSFFLVPIWIEYFFSTMTPLSTPCAAPSLIVLRPILRCAGSALHSSPSQFHPIFSDPDLIPMPMSRHHIVHLMRSLRAAAATRHSPPSQFHRSAGFWLRQHERKRTHGASRRRTAAFVRSSSPGRQGVDQRGWRRWRRDAGGGTGP